MSKIILACHGGGVRGAATTQFLARIEESLMNEHNKSIRDCVDFYAGTSTGSIIALALATTNLSMSEINELYNVTTAKKIFKENKGFFEFDGINAPRYEGYGKTKVLSGKFGTARIQDVPDGKHVLAVTYDVEKRTPVVFKSTNKENRRKLSSDIADASSAGPTYFPTKSLNGHWYVDGGVTTNNPTMCAIVEALRAWQETPISELLVLSVGTGFRTRKINGPESRKWGALGWFTKGNIIDLLRDEKIVSYQARTLLKDGNYIHVNSDMSKETMPNPPDDAMDDISKANIDKLKKMGDWWFNIYGNDAIKLLLGKSLNRSLDSIDPLTKKPT
ncbi:patatin-like phospholipase family protein (plasmid) [Photobacterium sp. GJ3]|uniref:patatin-like phospholipase family protein n=1 Tax=Photobacterium sp. GJ3 TaxID=2829502 RepID=UPI001B8B5428|nr:patatin-like phospholipase family protein [Photobacterium sp. GJ3]QUJ69244.1 patatin-like phospholipase family protein [Photobacterium sp. GJ3]